MKRRYSVAIDRHDGTVVGNCRVAVVCTAKKFQRLVEQMRKALPEPPDYFLRICVEKSKCSAKFCSDRI